MYRIFHFFTTTRIGQWLERTTMYRVVSSLLSGLVLLSLALGATGILAYGFWEQIISLVVILVTVVATDWVCARIWRAHVNYESALITGLIIYFLVIPAPLSAIGDSWQLIVVGALAMLSKFVVAYRKQHLLNPAAAGVVILALVYHWVPGVPGFFETGWWLGTPVMALPVAVAGVMIVTKLRKWVPVGAFLLAGCVTYLFHTWRLNGDVASATLTFWLSGPSLFLAAFMLTEPFTMPPTRRLQAAYGALVGVVLASASLVESFIIMTPELALVIGNLAAYPFTLRQKLFLTLQSVRPLADRTYEFVFKKPSQFAFVAGQYLEWMLPHTGADSRGIRRYFTIASSPTEPDVRLAMRIPAEAPSSFKRALQALTPGGVVIASQLAGDFTLPRDHTQKVALVAGGIGITPFRSQLAYLTDMRQLQDVVLFYCNNTRTDAAYADEFAHFKTVVPLQLVHVLAKEEVSEPPFEYGYLSQDIIQRRTPDYLERVWYLSGPPAMVNAYEKLLRELGVSGWNIKKDFFPGVG